MVAKRPSNTALPEPSTKTARRIQPESTAMAPFGVNNIVDGETVHQACLLVTGQCPTFSNSADDYILVTACDSMFKSTQIQNCPVYEGKWKALVLLQSGVNELKLEFNHSGGISSTIKLNVHYQPLLQTPPLHLAVLVAKDSPLIIDCPPTKYGAFTSTHNSLEAVINKFRTTALMWQALTAEDMREKGLGRRSFRLEEEWNADTLNLASVASRGTTTTQMASVPRIHIIRTDKTVAELRDPNLAQQNPSGHRRELLHDIFTKALKAHGTPFDSSCRPVVAGLIIDSHYSVEQDLILGHAALGCHNTNGLSLGVFGSHVTYSWPRFMEESPSCLTDATVPGDSVGNDNNECNTMAQACFVGQGAFLHEVGHAFGADHTTGIMARGYSKFWGHAFLAQGNSDHEAKWDLQDALRFKCKPHFRIPGDETPTSAFLGAGVTIEIDTDDDGEDALHIHSTAGLARVNITNGTSSQNVDLMVKEGQGTCVHYRTTDFAHYDRFQPLEVSALAMNGKHRVIKDVWKLFAAKPYIPLPGTNVRLHKQSIKSAAMESEHYDSNQHVGWTVLLRKRATNGKIVRATSIDLRVGCTFDGAVVYYSDGSHANCGPSTYGNNNQPYTIDGGHASESHDIPKNSRITKVQIGENGGWGGLDGIRMTLDNGEAWGHLNADEHETKVLEPNANEKIVGFFGTSGRAGYDFTKEFGIITAPKDFNLPDMVYDMVELQNFGERMDVDSDSESQSTVS